MRALSRTAAALMFGLLSVEASCAVFLIAARTRLPFFSFEKLVGPAHHGTELATYDPLLGWDTRYPTVFGERRSRNDYGAPFLAAFGDSFTAGIEVSDGETWEEQLEESLHADVYNFGVGAYGTDQAYLKFERDFRRIPTRVVTLGLISENINRIANVYRPFYFDRTGIPLTKPRFELLGNNITLVPNPIRIREEMENLGNPAFIRSVGSHDFWADAAHRLPALEFPYSFTLLNRRLWLWALSKWEGRISDINPRPWENLWEDPAMRTLLFKILDHFEKSAAEWKAVPIVMLFPLKHELLQKAGGITPLPEKLIDRYCGEKNYLFFDGIAALAGSAKTGEEIESYYSGHLSASGNEAIARTFQGFLKEHALYPDIQAEKKRADF